ncbi:MAG: PAS domain S-box protein, partial [Deltaproteobacteria bacterium]|nr:PAS domain S-box protein [Deltaproteobacteria bacterium]
EEQLRASETRMNRTQEMALLGSWELEAAENKLYWSDQVYSILGLSPQEVDASYEVFLDRVHPDDRTAVDEAYRGSLREGRDTYEIEHRVVRKTDGAVRIVHEKCEHIKDASGKTVRSVGMIHDITERKKVEEKLKESEERYRSLFENMLEGYAYCRMVFDDGVPADFIYLDVNKAFEVLTGLRNVVGKKVSEVVPGIRETDSELFRIYGRVASTGMPERFERYVEALGMWFSVSVYSPRKEHFVAVFDVITERKQAEEALRRTHEKLEMRVRERTAELESAHIKLKAEAEERKRLATAVEHAAEGVIIVDPSWHLQYVNPAFTAMTGYSQEESITKDIRFLQ